jgi:TolB protein
MFRRFFIIFLMAVCGFFALPVSAQLTIDIIGGSGTALPIAVVPFANERRDPGAVAEIVSSDLARSGRFRLVDETQITPKPSTAAEVNAQVYRAAGADAVVIGSVTPVGDGSKADVRFTLIDTVQQQALLSMSFTVAPVQFRATAHRIADLIYEKLTGEPGIFSTRIAYVTQTGNTYQLNIADADGFNPQIIMRSHSSIISPRFSPTGDRIAYVSFEHKKPVVYVQSLRDGSRTPVAYFRGSNSAPAWSPDGTELAVTLSREGGSQIFIVSAAGSREATRVMSSPGIDTEAAFMPDGKSLLFTSDRGGSPQIYRLWLADRRVERLTFEGTYNVSPRPLPSGQGMAYVRRENGRFQIATMDFPTRQILVLTQGPMDESPTIAPNGRYVLYTSQVDGRNVLSAVSIDGSIRQRIGALSEHAREPAWGPLH